MNILSLLMSEKVLYCHSLNFQTGKSHLISECVTYISIFDVVIVHVLGAGSILANIFVFSKLVDENLAAIPTIGLRETELGLRLLDGHGQLAEGCVGLLGVESLGQCCQV